MLNDRLIDRLVAREGFCILYTHLGKVASPQEPFGAAARAAFRRLAERSADGDVLVTTTRRLLDYVHTTKSMGVAVESDGPQSTICITLPSVIPAVTAPEMLQGITFYVSHASSVRLFVNKMDVTHWLVRNRADLTGKESVSIRWYRLELPDGL